MNKTGVLLVCGVLALGYCLFSKPTEQPASASQSATPEQQAQPQPSTFDKFIADWRPEHREETKALGPVKDAPKEPEVTLPKVQELIEKAVKEKAQEDKPVMQVIPQAEPKPHHSAATRKMSRSERLLHVPDDPAPSAFKLTVLEKRDIPVGFTGPVIYSASWCEWCPVEKRDVRAAGYASKFRMVELRSESEAKSRHMEELPVTVFFRNGIEVERTTGYDGTQKRLNTILRHTDALFREASYTPPPAPGVKGDALDDDPVAPVQQPSCSTPKAAPLSAPLCSSPASSIAASCSAPATTYTEVRSCATPDHPVLGYVANSASCSSPSSSYAYAAPSCSSPSSVAYASAPVTYSYALPTYSYAAPSCSSPSYSYGGGNCGSPGGGGGDVLGYGGGWGRNYGYSPSYGYGGGYGGGWGGGAYAGNCPGGVCYPRW
jgi:hypothetical protein